MKNFQNREPLAYPVLFSTSGNAPGRCLSNVYNHYTIPK